MKIFELLATPESWTRDEMARDKNGSPIDIHNPDACKWCLLGALDKCYIDSLLKLEIQNKIQERFRELKLDTASIVLFNDSSTHEEVLKLVTELDI